MAIILAGVLVNIADGDHPSLGFFGSGFPSLRGGLSRQLDLLDSDGNQKE